MDFETFRAEVGRHPLVLAYLTAPDCRVCDALRPKVAALVEDVPAWRTVFVDLSTAPEVAGQLVVFSVPSVILFVEGRESLRFGRSMALDELGAALERYAELLDAGTVGPGAQG